MAVTNGVKKPFKIIIVGAGPSGLLLALLLAKQNIHVTVMDLGTELDKQPRATHYAAPAVHELRRAGVIDDVRKAGFSPDGVCWRKLDGTYLSGIHMSVLPEDYPDSMACLPLNFLGEIIYEHLKRQPTAEVLWGHKVVRTEQDEHEARVIVEGNRTYAADYVVGCDGANSIVRRQLFGDWEFPGKTLDVCVVATNVYYPFEKFGFIDSNFIIDREHWYMAARISRDGMWRVSYGEVNGLTRDEYIERQPHKYETMLPGHPKPGDYRLTNINPYKLHQRCAEKFRVGRFLLAADAAHLCNPFGGLGLTGGMVDAGNLADCLTGVAKGLADDSILDKYDVIRREMWHNVINPISSENISRLYEQDPDKAMENDKFLQMLAEAEKNEDMMRKMILGIDGIKHDFTQYYHTPLERAGQAVVV